jgi:hypothetical protein
MKRKEKGKKEESKEKERENKGKRKKEEGKGKGNRIRKRKEEKGGVKVLRVGAHTLGEARSRAPNILTLISSGSPRLVRVVIKVANEDSWSSSDSSRFLSTDSYRRITCSSSSSSSSSAILRLIFLSARESRAQKTH